MAALARSRRSSSAAGSQCGCCPTSGAAWLGAVAGLPVAMLPASTGTVILRWHRRRAAGPEAEQGEILASHHYTAGHDMHQAGSR